MGVSGSRKAWRRAELVCDSPPGRAVREIPGFVPMVLVEQPDVLMVEFLEEQIGHIFSLKVDFLLWAGSEQLCFPKAKGTFSSAEGQCCMGPVQSGLESESPDGSSGRGQGHRPGTCPGLCCLQEPPGRVQMWGPGRRWGLGPTAHGAGRRHLCAKAPSSLLFF